MTFDTLVLLVAAIGSLFAGFWMSPRALAWTIAKMLARIDGLKTQRASFTKYLTSLEEEQ